MARARPLRVLVSGAGVGGLTAALSLHRAGFRVRLFGDLESTPNALGASPPARGASALGDEAWSQIDFGVPLWGTALRALDRLGVTRNLHQLGLPAHTLELCSSRGVAYSFDLGRTNGLPDLLCVPRPGLVEALARALPHHVPQRDASITGVACPHRVADYRKTAPAAYAGADSGGGGGVDLPHHVREHIQRGGVAVRAVRDSGREGWELGDVFVAADGARSAARAHLWPQLHAESRPLGFNLWRGAASVGPEDDAAPYFVAREVWGDYLRFGAMRIDAYRVHWYAQEWAGSDGSLEDMLELTSQLPFNVHSLVERTDPATLRVEGAVEVLSDQSSVFSRQKSGLFGQQHAQSHGAGPVTLLGSAAHPASVVGVLGQDTCMAVEDAAVLAHCLASGGGDVSGSLRLYEQLRAGRVHEVIRDVATFNRMAHLRTPVARWMRDYALARVPGKWHVARFLARLADTPLPRDAPASNAWTGLSGSLLPPGAGSLFDRLRLRSYNQ